MSETFIQLPTDGTGKKHRSWENTVGTDDVHATAGVITAPDGTVLSDTDGVEVNGNVASGAADSGNPIKAGGRYNDPQPTLDNGDRGDLQLDARGSLRVITSNHEQFAVWPYNTQGETLDAFPSGSVEGHINVGGNVASGAADGGRPVKVGGRYNSAAPTLDNGDRGDLQLDVNGRLIVAPLPAGTNNIGDVDVLSLPALPAGVNNIGYVNVATMPTSGTATLSNVATSTTSATLLIANVARRGVVIYNDSLVAMYVKFGTTASATSFTYYLAAGATFEMPTSPLYTGRIDGILASSTGTARVTELT